MFPDWIDFSRHAGSPTLVGFYNPTINPGIAALPAAQRLEPALDVLRKMFGSVPDPNQALITDWTGDPWAFGSYSYLPIGSTADDMRRLAEPASAGLVLAGEATIPEHHGTVHAAFGSGLSAATQVLGSPPERLSLGKIAPHWLPRA